MENMIENNVRSKTDRAFLYFTVPIVILIAISSITGIWHQEIYAKETTDWLSQCVGQDISNLFLVVPALILSAFFASKGIRSARIIWIGTMITNIYSYIIYCFSVHFNFLFHVYCIILGLSLYSVIYFFFHYMKEDYKSWYTEKVPVKATGIFLLIIAGIFLLLWLSQSLPAAVAGTVPENIIKDGLFTNPVHALDYSFYLPLMFISAVMLLKRKTLGYLLAPMMIVFAIITNFNIISLMFVTMKKTSVDSTPMIAVFGTLTIICLGFLLLMQKEIVKHSEK